MSDNGRRASMILDLRRRLLRAAAWYESARTTYEVLRLLDEQTAIQSARSADARRADFIPHPGFEV
jgi:hypothetical protein